MSAIVRVLASIRDTLIVAANNPVSHGGVRGLVELMKDRAARVEEVRVAVVELIGATRAYRAEAQCPDMNQFGPRRKPYDDAEARLDAILARVLL